MPLFRLERSLGAVLLIALLMTGISSVNAQDDPATAVSDVSPNEFMPGTTMVVRTTVQSLPDLPVLIGIGEWVLEPGSSVTQTVPGPEIYVTQSGILSVRVEGAAELTIAGGNSATPTAAPAVATPGVDYTLRPGDQISIQPGTEHTLRNDGDTPVEILNVVAFPASTSIPSWLGEPGFPAGVHFRTHAVDVVGDPAVLPPGPVEIQVTTLVLSPGEAPRQITAAPFDVLIVEDGGLVMRDAEETTLVAGDIVRLPAGTAPLLANESDQQSVILRLTVTPV